MTNRTIRRIEDIGTKLVILFLCGIAILALTFFGFLYVRSIRDKWLMRAANCALYAAMGLCALIGMKLSGMKLKKELDFANPWQYLWGVATFIPISLGLTIIPMLFSGSSDGIHMALPIDEMIYNGVFFIIFVGPVEELIFRQYVQELMVDILPDWKWMGAVITAVLFGVWHLVNGTPYQALLSTAVGMFLGLTKYFVKNCTLISVSLAHGLYDFFIYAFQFILIS